MWIIVAVFVLLCVALHGTRATDSLPIPAPSNLTFVDVDLGSGVLTGDLGWVSPSDDRIDYFIVYLSSTAEFSEATSKQIAAVEAPNNKFVVDQRLVHGTNYFLVRSYDTHAVGAFSDAVAVLVTDAAADDPPAAPSSIVFEDTDELAGFVSGTVVISPPAAAPESVAYYDVYLSSSLARNADVLFITSVQAAGNSSVFVDVGPSLALTSASGTFAFFSIYSRTASRFQGESEVGNVTSTLPARLRIDDRRDDALYLDYVADNTGNCGVAQFGPCVSTALDNGASKVQFSWRAPRLEQVTIVANKTVDLSDYFYNDVSLGSDTLPDACMRSVDESNWPFFSPSGGFGTTQDGAATQFSLLCSFSELRACGFEQTGLTLSGYFSLYVRSSKDLTVVQQIIQATVVVIYKDTTFASVGSVDVQNIKTLDVLQASGIALLSALRFYDEGFINFRAHSSFNALQDSMYFEHALTSDETVFFMTPTKIWFAVSDAVDSPSLAVVPRSDQAYTNAELPQPGRFRGVMLVPIVLNCQPCFLHVQSSLSVVNPSTAKRKKILSEPVDSFSSRALLVAHSVRSGSTRNFSLVFAATSILVATRFMC